MAELRGLGNATLSASSRMKGTSKSEAPQGIGQGGAPKVWGEEGVIAEAQEAVAQEVAEEEGLVDALEVMSLNLSAKVKEHLSQADRAKASRHRASKALKRLSHSALTDEMQSTLEALQQLDAQDLKSALASQPPGAQMLCIARWLDGGEDNSEKRQQLEEQMEQLLTQPHWALEAMTSLSLDRVTLEEMGSLNAVFQKALEAQPESGHLIGWFQSISHWERRDAKIKTLIRSLALELSIEYQGDRAERMASALHDLQRLSEFLVIEDHASILEKSFHLPQDRALQEILMMLDQPWVYEGWIQGRCEILGIPPIIQPAYHQYMLELLELLPDACFEHEMQRHQLMEVFEKLLAQQSSSAAVHGAV